MGKTFKRLGRRNRFLRQRRERMPTIRTVETTFDDIDRQTLSPVRQSSPLKTSIKRGEKDEYVSDDDVIIDHETTDTYHENDYVINYDKMSDAPIANDDVPVHLIDNNFDDDICSLDRLHSTSYPAEEPTCSSWATACQKLVEAAEEEYQNSVFIEETEKIGQKMDTTYGRMVSIGNLGKICNFNHENPYTIHYNR